MSDWLTLALALLGPAQEVADASPLAGMDEISAPVLLGVGVMVAAFGALLVALGVPRRAADGLIGPAPQPDARATRVTDVLLVAAPVLALIALSMIGGPAPEGADAAPDPRSSFDGFLVLVASNLFLFGVCAAIAVGLSWLRVGPGTLAVFGVRDLAENRVLLGRGLTAVVAGLTTVPFYIGATFVTIAAVLIAGGELPSQEIGEIIAVHLREHPVIVVGFAVVLQPLLEEVLFRGFLLEALRPWTGVRLAMVLSSAIFALAHGVAFFLPLFVLAMGLAWIKVRTRSLGLAWLGHMAYNGLMLLPLLAQEAS